MLLGLLVSGQVWAQFFPAKNLSMPVTSEIRQNFWHPQGYSSTEVLKSPTTTVEITSVYHSLPLYFRDKAEFAEPNYLGTSLTLTDEGQIMLRVALDSLSSTRHPLWTCSYYPKYPIFRLAHQDGLLVGIVINAPHSKYEEEYSLSAVFTLLWKYPGQDIKSVGLAPNINTFHMFEDRYGEDFMNPKNWGIILHNKAFGIYYKTRWKGDFRYLTYWLDSGIFTSSRHPVPSTKHPSDTLSPGPYSRLIIHKR